MNPQGYITANLYWIQLWISCDIYAEKLHNTFQIAIFIVAFQSVVVIVSEQF